MVPAVSESDRLRGVNRREEVALDVEGRGRSRRLELVEIVAGDVDERPVLWREMVNVEHLPEDVGRIVTRDDGVQLVDVGRVVRPAGPAPMAVITEAGRVKRCIFLRLES